MRKIYQKMLNIYINRLHLIPLKRKYDSNEQINRNRSCMLFGSFFNLSFSVNLLLLLQEIVNEKYLWLRKRSRSTWSTGYIVSLEQGKKFYELGNRAYLLRKSPEMKYTKFQFENNLTLPSNYKAKFFNQQDSKDSITNKGIQRQQKKLEWVKNNEWGYKDKNQYQNDAINLPGNKYRFSNQKMMKFKEWGRYKMKLPQIHQLLMTVYSGSTNFTFETEVTGKDQEQENSRYGVVCGQELDSVEIFNSFVQIIKKQNEFEDIDWVKSNYITHIIELIVKQRKEYYIKQSIFGLTAILTSKYNIYQKDKSSK
ncbi:unnamed protein product [Paramecium sonneborni]|uniref:Uncharacterized protein n=1 Tax=Paramecium sonneborni TaxID=65129 RepID=A0A8S1RVI7_9CILI|nr:unnamed protein product [Paramecium sonneborni]CAD8131343.1 unnamed protein product [Paramecium sonneborni]